MNWFLVQPENTKSVAKLWKNWKQILTRYICTYFFFEKLDIISLLFYHLCHKMRKMTYIWLKKFYIVWQIMRLFFINKFYFFLQIEHFYEIFVYKTLQNTYLNKLNFVRGSKVDWLRLVYHTWHDYMNVWCLSQLLQN